MTAQNTEASQATGWAALTFSPLENPLFRSIWIGGFISNLGTVIQRTVAAWVMVTIGGTPLLVSLVHTVAVLPMMLFALLAGALADMFSRKIQMIVALIASGTIAGILWLLVVMSWLTPFSLLLCTFLLGAGMAFYIAAWQSSVYEIVSPERLSPAISLNGLSFNTARSIGPAIGAELLAVFGAGAAFLANALSFIVLIFALLRWKPAPQEQSGPREMIGGAIADGLRFVSMSPSVRGLILRGWMFGFCGTTVLSMPPLMVVELGLGPRALGGLLAGFGVGAMAGALTAARLRAVWGAERVILTSSLILAAMLAVSAFSSFYVLTLVAMTVAGAGWVLGISTFQVAVQLSCPRWVAGRTISIFNMVYFFGLAVGSATWGLVAEVWSVPNALAVSSALLFVSVMVGRLLPIVEPALETLKPIGLQPPGPIPEIDPRAGPIVVTLEYRIRQGCEQEFLAAMARLKQIRRRDGARKWRLTHDLDDPSLWVERFHSPTWSDYLRRISRRLEGDMPVFDKVESLLTCKPVYHRRVETSVGKPGSQASVDVSAS